MLYPFQIKDLTHKALGEDPDSNNWAFDICVGKDKISRFGIFADESCCISGLELAQEVYQWSDPESEIHMYCRNGEILAKKTLLLEVIGNCHKLLKAEKTAMTFLKRFSGLATYTKHCKRILEQFDTQLLVANGTTPLYQSFEKAAMLDGGALTRRLCLTDCVQITQNTYLAAGGIHQVIQDLRESLSPIVKIGVVCTNLDQARECISYGADCIILRNMSVSAISMAVKMAAGRALVEANGFFQPNDLIKIAEAGVHFISNEALIQNSPWAQLTMKPLL